MAGLSEIPKKSIVFRKQSLTVVLSHETFARNFNQNEEMSFCKKYLIFLFLARTIWSSESSENPQRDAEQNDTNMVDILKRLEAKVHEFNLRFRSRRSA